MSSPFAGSFLSTDHFVAVDVETTGLDPSYDKITEIAIVVFGREGVVDRYSQLVNPKRHIPLDVVRLTGITDADVAGQPTIDELRPEIRRRIGTLPIVGHNVGYDLAMLDGAGLKFPNRQYDTYRLSQLLLPSIPSHSLKGVAEHFEIDPTLYHRAMADAETTMSVFLRMLERLEEYDDRTLHQAARLGQQAGWPEAQLLREAADKNVSGPLFDHGAARDLLPELRFAEPRERPEVLQRTGVGEPLDVDSIEDMLATDGPLSKVLERYESRPTQTRMATAVARAFNQEDELLVEAGTGTGKSLAYLLPAAVFALARGERVVITTNTIALQDQLYRKDLPDVRTVLAQGGVKEDLKVAVMKGRNNYLCLQRWFDHQNDPVEDAADASLRAKILMWLPFTETGDRAELRLNREEEAHWRKFASEKGRCSPKRCSFARVNQCFLYRARHNAAAAHIVIANHSLVLSNSAQGYVLPPFKRLVIDEAHHLEDEATDQFSWSVSRTAIEEPTRILINAETSPPGGLFAIAATFFSRLRDEEASKATTKANEHVGKTTQGAIELTALSAELIARMTSLLPPERKGYNPFPDKLRITDVVRYRHEWLETTAIWRQIDTVLVQMIETGGWFLKVLDSLSLPDDDTHPDSVQRDELTLELQNVLESLIEVRGHLKLGFGSENHDFVMWIERSPQLGVISINGAPLDVSQRLREEVFNELQTCILTSATLTVDGSFDYVADRLGLQLANSLPLGSPFDHERSTMVYIPDDLPEPTHQNFQQALNEILIELVTATRGRALVLFTSHGQLQATRKAIKAPLERRNIAVMGQRVDGSFRQLVDNLRSNPGTVILGTSSFWEGVDIVGDALSVVVIVKLPFPVPSDPIFEARSELLTDSFLELSVPQAVLRFKQGFGRLIRSATDRGVCVVLDRRVISRRYGQAFLHSLPPSRTVIASGYDLASHSQSWLEDERMPLRTFHQDEGVDW